jgi:hypothetical protein
VVRRIIGPLKKVMKKSILSLVVAMILTTAIATTAHAAGRPFFKDVYASYTIYNTSGNSPFSLTFRGPKELAQSRASALVMDRSFQWNVPEYTDASMYDHEVCRLHYAGGTGWTHWRGHWVIETVTVHSWSDSGADVTSGAVVYCALLHRHNEAH